MPAGTTNFPGSLDSHTGGDPFGFAQVNNLAQTLTTASHTNSVTTITVSSTTAFESRGYIKIKREIVSYTGKTSTTFTGCTRAADGTLAAAYLSGTVVEQVVVAANHNAHSAAIVAIETVLGAGITPSYGVVRKIAEASGTGSSGVLEFSSIPATYRSLMLHVVGRSTHTGTTSTGWRVTFETSPTSGTYHQQLLQVFGSTTQPVEQISFADFLSAGVGPTADSTANWHASAVIHLPEYANTNMYKTLVAYGMGALDKSTGNMFFRFVGGIWESLTAIDRVRLTLAAGNWTTSSRATLYGIPA